MMPMQHLIVASKVTTPNSFDAQNAASMSALRLCAAVEVKTSSIMGHQCLTSVGRSDASSEPFAAMTIAIRGFALEHYSMIETSTQSLTSKNLSIAKAQLCTSHGA